MRSNVLNKRPIQITINALIILGALFVIFTPNYVLFKIGSSFAVHIMLSYLLLGLLFLVLRQPQLTFTSFFCCAVLCLFLKYYSNWDWPLLHKNRPAETAIIIAHFNVANAEKSPQETMEDIMETDADVLSFQEVTPDWQVVFEKNLRERYPYATSIVRLDPHGLALYSRLPIVSIDTFYFDEIPNLAIVIKKGHEQYRLISSYTDPPIYSLALENLQQHMARIVSEIKKSPLPTFAIGDYNAPPWWEEIRYLMHEGKLLDSRSCAPQGLDNLWKYPVDYIFHSSYFECTGFEKIEKTLYGHLGIEASFQINRDKDVQAALQ